PPTDMQKFCFGDLVQGYDSVVDYHLKLKKCNEIARFSEIHL
ncbi:6385_t:CDS:1, partial [Entrophospora sp. SA101]